MAQNLVSQTQLQYEQTVAVSALNVNCGVGRTYFTKTIASNNTFTFSNIPAAPNVFAFTLKIVHTSGAITWPSSVKWAGEAAPTLATPKTHLFTFLTDDGGVSWFGNVAKDYTT